MTKKQYMAMSLPFDLYMYMESLDGKIETPYKLRPEWLEHDIDLKNIPILHPPSDISKPIVHKGEIFVPIQRIAEICGSKLAKYRPGGYGNTYHITRYINNEFNYFFIDTEKLLVYGGTERYDTNYSSLLLLELLLEWHFDIAHLIELGEAIDVNKLPINPYC